MDYETQKTIVMLVVFGFLGTGLMVVRLVMRKGRGQRFNCSDYLTMAAIVCLAARTAFTTVVVLWGNNNLTKDYRSSHQFSAADIYQREVGSKLTLVNRIVYNTYIWTQKAVVMLLYRRMLSCLPWPRHIMNVYWGVLAVTYAVSQVFTFVECRPVYLYWQVVPDPGICSEAPLQLIVFVSLNITTDIMLIILPMPWLVSMKRSLKERIQLVGLFSIGFLLIAIGFVRLPINWGNGTTQINRNTWGSVEAFAAAFVANVPTLFALRRRSNLDNDRAGSQNMNSTWLSGFRQMKSEGIIHTNSNELHDHMVQTSTRSSNHQAIWEKQCSNDNIVYII